VARKKRRGKRASPASFGYSVAIIILLAAVVFLALSLYGVFAPRPARAEPPTVLVLNGCGTPGVGERTARLLRSHGLDVVDYRNAPSFDYRETIVIDRTGDMGPALNVGRLLRVGNIIQQIPETPLVDVVVVIGSDHERFLAS
jgi:hypothetical protein